MSVTVLAIFCLYCTLKILNIKVTVTVIQFKQIRLEKCDLMCKKILLGYFLVLTMNRTCK